MTDTESSHTDTDVLDEAFRVYDEEFAEYVGEVVTPYEYVNTQRQVDWAARTFMFAFGLGAVAGANAATPEERAEEVTLDRVEQIVDDIVDIHADDDRAVSTSRVRTDFLDG
jgi:hypothetical protein